MLTEGFRGNIPMGLLWGKFLGEGNLVTRAGSIVVSLLKNPQVNTLSFEWR